MTSRFSALRLRSTLSNPTTQFQKAGVLRVAGFLVLVALFATSFYSSSSASVVPISTAVSNSARSEQRPQASGHMSAFSWLIASPLVETVETYKGPDCTIPWTDFSLGEIVCAKVTDAPTYPFFALRRITWVDPSGFVVHQEDIASASQTFTFTLPAVPISIDGTDSRGTWSVNMVATSDASTRAEAAFSVKDPDAAAANLTIFEEVNSGDAIIASGEPITYNIAVVNRGPDAAENVVLTKPGPELSDGELPVPTFVSWTQLSGPTFTCATNTACTIASLPAGEGAKFQVTYTIPAGTPDYTIVKDTSTVSSATTDPKAGDNASSAFSTVLGVAEEEACTLTCPANVVVTADTTHLGESGAFVQYSAASVLGDCGGVSNSPITGSFFTVGTHTITSTAGSGATCTFTVTVLDSAPPTISCPPDKFGTANNDGVADVDPGTPTTTPATGLTVVGERSDFKPAHLDELGNLVPAGPGLNDPYPAGTTGIRWTATDAAGRSVACTQRIIVTGNACGDDEEDPTIDAPDNITVSTGPDNTGCSVAIDELGEPNAGDNCSVSVTISGLPPNSAFPIGITTLTYTATDGAGNTATDTQTVTVTDDTPPSIVAPADATYTCMSEVPAANAADAKRGAVFDENGNQLPPGPPFDNCGNPAVTVSESSTGAGSAASPRIITRVFTATDGAPNSSSATQTITVIDNEAPTITAPAGVTAYTGPGAASCDTTVALGTPTTGDNCAGVTVTRSPSGNTFPVGTTEVVWTATDAAGNTATATQQVTVNDNTAPVITAPANVTVGTGPGATSCDTLVSDAQLGNATANDNCSVTVVRSGVPAGNVFPKGNTTITYTATDGAGNVSTATQTVTVNDTTTPTISCQANIIADYNPAVNGATVSYTAPVSADNCPGATTAQIAGLPSGATFPVGTTTNTFRVTDASGNTAECSFKVTVALTSLIGLDSVTMTGSAYADSYSSTGGYPATKGSLANVLSNGTITMGNSAKVWGNVRSTRAGINMTGASQVTGNATAGTTVTTSGAATVGGTRTNNALAPVMTLPAVPACSPFSSSSGITGNYSYNPSTGNLTLSGVNIATLANGNYCFNNVTLGNSAQLTVNGPVVIKLTGTLNTSGATSLNNTTQIPSNLRILSSYSGSNGVILGNSASTYLVVYAPNTGVNISGSAPLFGTAAGKSITMGNTGAIHYDTTLISIWPDLWTLIVGP